MRVMEMVAVHDLVEIDAGDVSAYAVDASKAIREQAAADRIFALLPDDQHERFAAGLADAGDRGDVDDRAGGGP